MVYSDSHCHLDRYQAESLTEMLQQARANKVDFIVSQGMNLESSADTVRLAQSQPGVYAAVGIHPWNAITPTEELRGQLRQLAGQDKVVAIGEIGLDYARSPETKDTQKELLKYELSLALETGLPVNIHCREAHQDMMDILRQEARPGLKGIIHGFTGGLSMLKDWLDLGFYISIGGRGFVTSETPALLDAIRQIPQDRLLTETDAAGQAGGPADVTAVVQKLASIREATEEEIANTATANLKRIHGI
ncbi:MAG: TatD family hydrolase [Dehalococcoidales bacterium]|nr:MAG: TatD family hydrolase [Dehalococcoidales bacterium]